MNPQHQFNRIPETKARLPLAAAVGAVTLSLASLPTLGQTLVIESFAANGLLVCTNLSPGSVATVEWAPSVSGPWTNTWAPLEAVAANAAGAILVRVPMFYRVREATPRGMVWIEPGTFTMGSPDTEPGHQPTEAPHTEVTLTKGFWIGKYEVTQREYLAVMGRNPSYFNGTRNGENYGVDLDRPVEQVSHNDAFLYCMRLTQLERTAGRLPGGYEYRLPTEAQWEYACRAGTTTATAYGDTLSSYQANFFGNYPYNGAAQGPFLRQTTRVGLYAPNAWGLYDMHGNVTEMCADWWGPYPGGSVTDPTGPPSGSAYVGRGGDWGAEGQNCRSAVRMGGGGGAGTGGSPGLGFRVALVVAP